MEVFYPLTVTLNGSQIVAETWGNQIVIYLYDEFGSPIGMVYRNSNMAADQFETYFFEKNMFGDILAVYNTSGKKQLSYSYDAFGNCTVTTHVSSNALLNRLRYRGYYHDGETGFYYLNSRYYDPVTCRFINADNSDILFASPYALTDKNLFAYCDNNPVIREDNGGMFWETVFDIVSLCFSVAEVVATPTNPMSWVSLAGDVVDLIPFVTGVGETAKVIGATIKITNAVDNTTDTIKVFKAADFTGEALDKIRDLERTGDAVKSSRNAGKIIHDGYKTNINVPNIKRAKEHNFGIANRVDFFDGESIFELKPMNPKGLRDGIKQLQRYNKASHGKYNLILELYG